MGIVWIQKEWDFGVKHRLNQIVSVLWIVCHAYCFAYWMSLEWGSVIVPRDPNWRDILTIIALTSPMLVWGLLYGSYKEPLSKAGVRVGLWLCICTTMIDYASVWVLYYGSYTLLFAYAGLVLRQKLFRGARHQSVAK